MPGTQRNQRVQSIWIAFMLCLSLCVATRLPGVYAATVAPIQVYQFTVQGVTNETVPLQGSPAGVDFGGAEFNIYYMQYWPQEYHTDSTYSAGYIAYLVNVTATDFRIGYLYLRNDMSTFQMYYYDYQLGQVVEYYFTGQESIGTAMVETSPASPPQPTFSLQPEYQNQVYMQASPLNLQSNIGTLNGEQVYVLYNLIDVTPGLSTTWNEVWTITSNYHFIIFYTYNSDPGAVTYDDLNLATDQFTVSQYPGSWTLTAGTPLQTVQTAAPNETAPSTQTSMDSVNNTNSGYSLSTSRTEIMNDGSGTQFTVSGFASNITVVVLLNGPNGTLSESVGTTDSTGTYSGQLSYQGPYSGPATLSVTDNLGDVSNVIQVEVG